MFSRAHLLIKRELDRLKADSLWVSSVLRLENVHQFHSVPEHANFLDLPVTRVPTLGDMYFEMETYLQELGLTSSIITRDVHGYVAS